MIIKYILSESQAWLLNGFHAMKWKAEMKWYKADYNASRQSNADQKSDVY